MTLFEALAALRQTGSYLLRLNLASSCSLEIGGLGRFCFPAGVYLYAGSALGSGGLAARLRRHSKPDKTLRWHIDYLRLVCALEGALVYPHSPSGQGNFPKTMRLECLWSQALAVLPQAQIPVPGFGSRDCRSGCRAHLVYLPRLALNELYQAAGQISPGAIWIAF